MARMVVLTLAAVGALVLGWAVWLLFTPDPDGGRHPVGGLLLVVGLLFLGPALVALRRQRRP
jgi:hypothetical protein